MKYINRCILRSKSRERLYLYFSYIANAAVTCMLLMVVTKIVDVVDGLSNYNDSQQMEGILFTMLFISFLTIIFFQWIISIQFRALFNSRKQFNDNLRFIGATPKMIYRLYIKEMIAMQPISIFLGIVVGEIIYAILSLVLDIELEFIGAIQIIVACFLHLAVVFVSVSLIYRKVSNKSVIDSVKVQDDREFKLKLRLPRLFFGITMLVISILVIKTNVGNTDATGIALLVSSISIFLLLNAIIHIFHFVVLSISKALNNKRLIFSQFISIGYLKKSSVMCVMVLISATLFLGLQMLYNNVRNSGAEVVENNVHYEATVWHSLTQNNYDSLGDEAYYGLKYMVQDAKGIWYVNGIDSTFFDTWETITVCDETAMQLETISVDFDNENWNGIIIPNTYTSYCEIGSFIDVEINGKILEFQVVGKYYSNNFAHLNFFASKAYIQKQLSLPNEYNIVYLKDSKNLDNISTEHTVIQKFEDIRKESYEKIVQGTEIIELTSIIIIICALISIINFIMLSSKNDSIDIAKLRGMGIEQKSIYNIYIYSTVLPVVISLTCAVPAFIAFAKSLCLKVLDSYYFQGGFIVNYMDIIFVFLLFCLITLLARVFSIRKIVKSNTFIYVLRDING